MAKSRPRRGPAPGAGPKYYPSGRALGIERAPMEDPQILSKLGFEALKSLGIEKAPGSDKELKQRSHTLEDGREVSLLVRHTVPEIMLQVFHDGRVTAYQLAISKRADVHREYSSVINEEGNRSRITTIHTPIVRGYLSALGSETEDG